MFAYLKKKKKKKRCFNMKYSAYYFHCEEKDIGRLPNLY